MKQCFKCLRTLSIDEFYAHPRMADGHLNKCKECTKRDVRHTNDENWIKRAEYEKERSKRPERKLAALRYQASQREREPQKTKARSAVRRAVKSGGLVRKPCEVCGTTEKVEAHHEDYSKPLDVRWLCFAHHRMNHDQVPVGSLISSVRPAP